jgi:protein disulfide-isomerase-like protein
MIGIVLILVQVASVASSGVIQFGQNLESTIASGRPLLVQFYAPWCGHCQQLAPTWEKVGNKIGRDVTVGKLDCTQHQNLAQKYSIRGFPTIKFFRNGRPIDYEGARTESEIIKFVSRASGPAVVKLSKTLNSLIKSRPDPPVFILIGQKESQEFEMFTNAAEGYIPNIKFYYIPV